MSRDRDGRVSPAQMKKLLDLLSVHGVLLDGRVVYKNTNKRTFWKHIAVQLNAVDNGANKNFYKWCKMWADWKNKTKKKADIVVRTGVSVLKPNFTRLELRLLKLIKYPVDDLMAAVYKDKNQNPTERVSIMFNESSNLVEDSFEGTELDDKKNREYVFFGTEDKKESSHSYNIFDNEEISGLDVKIEALTDKKTSTIESLEDYKVKAQIFIEKERIHQKGEELKLKALELKLRSEELKLQEAEVSKVSFLTSLEEKKLKCMTEIAASLKELVEWTRNGSARFHNVM